MERLEPVLPVTAVKSYAAVMPLATHWRPATCEEVDCPSYLYGWQTVIDESTEMGQRQARYIRRKSGRGFTEERQPGGLTEFTFPAGQRCFGSADHMLPTGRPERFLERDGDWRGNPTGRQVEHSASGWLDSFGEHQQRVADALEEG